MSKTPEIKREPLCFEFNRKDLLKTPEEKAAWEQLAKDLENTPRPFPAGYRSALA
jgi:hypothetical protein